MTQAAAKEPVEVSLSDPQLVEECRQGNEEAWSALIDKYKNLIFSIPIKYGLSREDAAEIFQQVCVELFLQLPNLRNPQGLAKWLMQVTAHRCFHWKQHQRRFVSNEDEPGPEPAATAALPEELLREVETEQQLRDELQQLSPRCRQLIELLFFQEPALPYSDVAASLGIATGSIGFIRGRCLEKLRARLEEIGFK